MYHQRSKAQKPSIESLPDSALLRLDQLIADRLVPFSKATIWRKCRTGEFPSPIKVSDQITAWRLGDIREWSKNPAQYRNNKKRVAA